MVLVYRRNITEPPCPAPPAASDTPMPAPYELTGASYDWDDAPADVTAAAPAIVPGSASL